MLVSGQTYEVFNNEGVLMGYVNVPLGITIFDFDVMGNLISLDKDTEITPPTNDGDDVDDNPKTGVVAGTVMIFPALLAVVLTHRTNKTNKKKIGN